MDSFVQEEVWTATGEPIVARFFAPRTMKRTAPADVGAESIGHFGFFKPVFEQSLWRSHLLPELSD